MPQPSRLVVGINAFLQIKYYRIFKGMYPSEASIFVAEKFEKKYGFNDLEDFIDGTENNSRAIRQGDGVLDSPFLQLSENDFLTLGQACEGIHIFGGTGSGKTSGSGKTLALEFLRLGMGRLVLCAKSDELETWQRYAKNAGRENDLVIFDMEHDYRFNFMNYEFAREGAGAGQSLNIVDLIIDVSGIGNTKGSDRGDDQFFAEAARRMLTNAVEFCQIGLGRVYIEDIIGIIRSAPRSDKAHEKGTDEHSELMSGLLMQALIGAKQRQKRGELSPLEARTLDELEFYWLNQFYREGGQNTLNSIISTLSNITDMFQRGTLYELFCTSTNVTPEDSFNGKIIILNLSIQDYRRQGEIAQQIFKTMWQLAVQRREVEEETLPSFLWVDEAQLFLTRFDQEFMTIARSARAATVFLSQNYPNYLARLGEISVVDSLLGNFQTKIFHQNIDASTNEWASNQIGKHYTQSVSSGGTFGREGTSHSRNVAEDLRFHVLPSVFTTLKKGRAVNDFEVEGIMISGGIIFAANGRNFLKVSFNQKGRE